MKVFAVCMECQKELGHPSPEAFSLPYYDDRIAYVTCSKGHKSALMVQSPRFEVLLESGANSLADGQTLEATTVFASALERFYEFCVEVFCIEREMPQELYQRMFNDMARQSERQIGAFLTLHALELGSPYAVNPKIAELRNKYVHKGMIPNVEEATVFCGMVYDEIRSLVTTLTSKYAAAYHEAISRDLRKREKSVPKEIPIAISTGTIFFRSGKSTFQEALQAYVHGRNMIQLAQAVFPMFANIFANRSQNPETKEGESSS